MSMSAPNAGCYPALHISGIGRIQSSPQIQPRPSPLTLSRETLSHSNSPSNSFYTPVVAKVQHKPLQVPPRPSPQTFSRETLSRLTLPSHTAVVRQCSVPQILTTSHHHYREELQMVCTSPTSAREQCSHTSRVPHSALTVHQVQQTGGRRIEVLKEMEEVAHRLTTVEEEYANASSPCHTKMAAQTRGQLLEIALICDDHASGQCVLNDGECSTVVMAPSSTSCDVSTGTVQARAPSSSHKHTAELDLSIPCTEQLLLGSRNGCSPSHANGLREPAIQDLPSRKLCKFGPTEREASVVDPQGEEANVELSSPDLESNASCPGVSHRNVVEVLKELETMERALINERESGIEIVETYERVFKDKDASHARDIAALEEMLTAALEEKRQLATQFSALQVRAARRKIIPGVGRTGSSEGSTPTASDTASTTSLSDNLSDSGEWTPTAIDEISPTSRASLGE